MSNKNFNEIFIAALFINSKFEYQIHSTDETKKIMFKAYYVVVPINYA